MASKGGKTRRFSVVALAVLLLAAAAAGERLPIKTYTIADGLARDFVRRIKQDSHGFIWLCTAEGLSRFDGYGFTNYGLDDGLPSLPTSEVVLHARRDRTLTAVFDAVADAFRGVPVEAALERRA